MILIYKISPQIAKRIRCSTSELPSDPQLNEMLKFLISTYNTHIYNILHIYIAYIYCIYILYIVKNVHHTSSGTDSSDLCIDIVTHRMNRKGQFKQVILFLPFFYPFYHLAPRIRAMLCIYHGGLNICESVGEQQQEKLTKGCGSCGRWVLACLVPLRQTLPPPPSSGPHGLLMVSYQSHTDVLAVHTRFNTRSHWKR